MAAAGLAQVFARDPHPLEPRRVGEHLPQELAVARLDLLALLELAPSGADSRRQGIAHALELAEAERAGRASARGGHRGLDPQARKRLRRELAELTLEAADLAPQLLAGEALVAADAERGGVVSLEQIGHGGYQRV